MGGEGADVGGEGLMCGGGLLIIFVCTFLLHP